LTRDSVGSENQGNYSLREAQISCVVHGFDEWQWTTYAFEDTQHDAEDEGDEVVDRQLYNGQVTFGEEDEDPISLSLDRQLWPIWRPRQYFLKAFEMQIRRLCGEWSALVHKLEVDRTEYVRPPHI
jgi:hypothetical protein